MTRSSCPACHQYFITDITGGPLRHIVILGFNRIDSLLDRSVARCCLRQQVFPTILAQACHKTLTSWVCRLLGGGYSLYNSWTLPPLRKNSPNAETRMLNPGQEVSNFAPSENMQAGHVLSSSCLVGDPLQQLSAFADLLLQHQSMRSCRALRSGRIRKKQSKMLTLVSGCIVHEMQILSQTT